jgi:hypothetical protein
MKKYLACLVIKEMQIKMTLRFHLTSVRMAVIKKTNNKCWQGCRKDETPICYWWIGKLVQAPWKSVWKLLKNLKMKPLYDPAIPFLVIRNLSQ